ncbi:MAG: ATP-dependent helicase [Cytophagaceae bacterium]|nr:ATP-dependent helicase [Cytophagaceae bacterium]MDW8456569.1 ATP-dependent DNA helicase [Cytophagaceae bacterium]
MKKDYISYFKHELSLLNPEQKRAVEDIEGPMLVIAGPGTGKTQILAARIGKILYETDTHAGNILCLTYTDAGTIAMRRRLLQFIGPEAYKVNIHTFHAFCNMVILENQAYFGIRDLQIISELQLTMLLEELIDNFSVGHLLRRNSGDIYYDKPHLKNLFSTMKRYGWEPDYIKKKIDEYLDELINNEEYQYKRNTKTHQKGSPNQKYEKIKQSFKRTIAAVDEYKNFQKLMNEKSLYDYDDMIRWVLQAFQENENLRADYQERFLYILVDEYQDTSGSQNQLLDILASYWDNPNIFVVGDDDQSIYSFQGANVDYINNFRKKYSPHLKVVLLRNNYRSTQAILDMSKALINHNKKRLINEMKGLDKNLIASNERYKNSTVSPIITEYYNPTHEEWGIIKKIEQLYSAGQKLSQIAVIYRKHKQVENIVNALQKRNIPLNIRKKTNILTLPVIQNLVTLLNYLYQEHKEPDSGEHLLFEIMHFNFWGIPHSDIVAISHECSKGKDISYKSWRSLMASNDGMSRLGLTNTEAITALHQNLCYWSEQLPNVTVQTLFEKILTRSGLLDFIMRSNDRDELLQAVTTFFDFIKEESSRQFQYKLSDLIETLNLMKNYSIELELNQYLYAENGVNFVSAHSSKGLEFEYVFLIGATSNQWEKSKAGNTDFKLPPNLIKDREFDESENLIKHANDEKIEKEKEKPSHTDDKREEERRLFYVALTRAKEHLFISYPACDNTGKALESSAFVEEIKDSGIPIVEKKHFSDEEILTYQAENLITYERPPLHLMDKNFIDEKLKNYRMSVTQLNKYLKCPLTFYFENIVMVPSARTESMGFGNAVHYALQKFFDEASKNKTLPPPTLLKDAFIRGMEIYQSHFTEKEYNRRVEQAIYFFPKYYEVYKDKWTLNVITEYRILHAETAGVPITGMIDKIEFLGNNKINVVDYKTGRPENAMKKLKGPSDSDPNGGDYWRQIVFYKLLLESDYKLDVEMISGEIDFVELEKKSDSFVKEKIVVTPKDMEIVKNQIRTTYQKIMNHEFLNGCNADDCYWCNFVNKNFSLDKLVIHNEDEQ